MKPFPRYNLLLADDDLDDCIFFREALEELPIKVTLDTVNDGAALIRHLDDGVHDLPDMLFLDLNMPLKTGYECLSEIKRNHLLSNLPIIIISTSFDPVIVDKLYEKGADYYIRKPKDFASLKQVIDTVIKVVSSSGNQRPIKENFVLNKE